MAKRKQRATLLLVGEGDTEVAFLKYLKSVYCKNRQGPKVTIRNAHGKGPGNVLKITLGQQRIGSYDRVAAVLDTDIPWTKGQQEKAHKAKINMIGNTPCIEGTFLKILDLPAPKDSNTCKSHINEHLPHNLLDASSYPHWCTQEKLEVAANQLNDLKRLIKLYAPNKNNSKR